MIGSFKYAWFLNNVVSALTNFLQLGSDINGEAIGDESGYSVSLNATGDIVAIGAPKNDDNGYNSGHTRIYKWNGTAWTQMGYDIDAEFSDDISGHSVSLNAAGDTLAIGSITGGENGCVRIYQWSGATWTQIGLDIGGEANNDLFGWSVSLNAAGDIVAIGAPGNSENGTDSGHTRIYRWSGTAWTQMGSDINGLFSDDISGWSVSLNAAGDIVAIGAPNNDANGTNSGHVRIYRWSGTAWTQIGLDIGGEAEGDNSGWSVSLNAAGDRVAIGAPKNDDNGYNSGHTRIYKWNGETWTQMGSDINGRLSTDVCGTSVSLNAAGDIVAIGAPRTNMDDSTFGYVRIYRWSGTDWTQMALDIDSEIFENDYGHSVSLNAAGDTLAIGAPHMEFFNYSIPGYTQIYSSSPLLENGKIGSDLVGIDSVSNSGYSISLNHSGDIIALGEPDSLAGGTGRGTTRVFKLSGNTYWIQLGQTLNGLADGDSFGESVSLNSSGNRIAIGAPYNDAGGANRGVTRILQLSGNNVWTSMGEPISGVANNDYSGYSVSLNSLGNRVIIGSPNSAGGGTLRGSARVFQWDGTDWTLMINISGEANNDYYGTSVSINALGDVVAIGAPYNDGGGVDSGHVRVFNWSGTAWVQRGSDINGVSAGVGLGQYVCLNDSGDVLATAGVSAAGNAGYVAVYSWNDSAWVQQGNFIGSAAGDSSGSLYLNSKGNRLIIGAPLNDQNIGHMRVYDLNGMGEWILNTEINGSNISPGDGFGFCTAINSLGDIIAGSALSGKNSSIGGYTRIYKIDPPVDYNQIYVISSSDANSQFGYDVDINETGDTIIIGVPNQTSTSTARVGYATVYKNISGTWTQFYNSVSGRSNTYFGGAVSINDSGDTIAVGTLKGTIQEMHIYNFINNLWTLKGMPISATKNATKFSRGIELNGVGDKLLSCNDEGVVRLHGWNGSSWNQEFTTTLANAGNLQISINKAGNVFAFSEGFRGSLGMDGIVYVYMYNGSDWVMKGSTITGSGNGLGRYLKIDDSGNKLFLGYFTPNIDPDTQYNIAVYEWNGSQWLNTFDIPNPDFNDFFEGIAVNGLGTRIDMLRTNGTKTTKFDLINNNWTSVQENTLFLGAKHTTMSKNGNWSIYGSKEYSMGGFTINSTNTVYLVYNH